ncbi:eukaryotic translation initiation factor 5 [Selaginella moellendorffii]|uniref:eukaryotic translation initiation factor 5 n=1 Tax=Selaginella moellendorffii TaxID=88036 RepID=UPI000D1C6756|nr:eukaryotic translation initiation factor 5 [Selaginella moellendorffii]|eukprot:XP_024529513.1 eukaryotic translation initiation factor 5 [Selaginella moellendorffii]
MALLNIGASNKDDAFYRYKMPRLVTKIEGRGNGIKTNIVNMVDVAKALARPPAYTTKYFGCELGAQSKFDEKTGTSIVNGAHDHGKLAALLEHFIKKYVQCYGCSNPETEILVSKAGMITLNCAACGYISNVDMRDKLTTFIVKNPPEQKKSGKDKKLRRAEKERLQEGELADEEMKKSKKEGSRKKKDEDKKAPKKKPGSDEEEEVSPVASQADDEEVAEDEDDVQWQADTSAEAAKQRMKEQLTSVTTEMVMLAEPEEDKPVDSPRVGVGGGKSKMRKSLSSKKSDIKEADIPKLQELSLHDKLVKDLKAKIASGCSAAEAASLVLNKPDPPLDVMVAYFQALFDGVSKDLFKEVKKSKEYLEVVVQDESCQKNLLVAMEVFASTGVDVSKQMLLVLKFLYDADVLEEEHILEWYSSKPSPLVGAKAENVKKAVEPFIQWLENAEAETETEDE